MLDFYDIDQANERLPELRETLLRLLDLRGDVVELRDRVVELDASTLQNDKVTLGGHPASKPVADPQPAIEETGEAQRLMMRMKALIDQMEAAVVQLDRWSIQLREIETGLVDFPALASGRPVWLCWRLGEERVEWWHEMTEGFEGRRRIEDLV